MIRRALVATCVLFGSVTPALAQDSIEGTYRLRRWEFGPSHNLYVKVWITETPNGATLTRQVGRDPTSVLSAPIERLTDGRLQVKFAATAKSPSATAHYTIAKDGSIQGTFETADAAGVTERTQESGSRIAPEPIPDTRGSGPESLTLQFLGALEAGYGPAAAQAAKQALTQHYASAAASVQGDAPLTFAEEELVALARVNVSDVDVSQLPRVKAAVDAKAALRGQPGALAGVSVESVAGVLVAQIRSVDVDAARGVANALIQLYVPLVRRDARNQLAVYSGPRSAEESQLVALLVEAPEVGAAVDLSSLPWVRLAVEGQRQ